MSVLMSAPGPIIVGIGFIVGKSSTQLSDFIRRSAELIGLIAAYITFLIAEKDSDNMPRKFRIEQISNIIVGVMMTLAGSIMLILSFTGTGQETGNVIPGLVVSVLGVIANTLFWVKYTRLNRKQPNSIIAVQARLYRAKSLVDFCVTCTLIFLLLMPKASVSALIDTAGSAVVSAYLALCGIKTIIEAIRRKPV